MYLARAVASLGGVGFLRPAPGSWGSAAVLPAACLGLLPCLVLAVIFALSGLWAVRQLGEAGEDPGWVVVDEAAGQCVALACLPADGPWWGVLAAFLLFRAFDILKPGPVGWADRQEGAIGVMLDDVIAGILAGAVILVARAVGWP